MTKLSVIIFTFLLFAGCKSFVPSVNLVNSQDPDIVLVNIEDGDREFIGKVLLKIDSLNPELIAIDALFKVRKSTREDSFLIAALRKIDNDILPYDISSQNELDESGPIFNRLAKEKGFLKFDRTLGLISKMTPIPKIGNSPHESFAYKIVKNWKRNFTSEIEVNQQIPINYQRPLEKYLRLDGSFLLGTNMDNLELKNKIFLVGYIGPGTEDKYSTPLRFVGKEYEHDEPDTYGLVIIANQIRTIIDYKK